MSNAAVINATSTSGQTVGAPISIETGGDVVLKAYGTGSGNWFVVMAFAPVVNGVTGAPVTLTIDYNQPGRKTSSVGTSATKWVGWVLDQGGTWEASGIVEGYQPGEVLSDDLGTFASFNALPQYGVKIGARASVNGVQYTYGAAGWVDMANRWDDDALLVIGDSRTAYEGGYTTDGTLREYGYSHAGPVVWMQQMLGDSRFKRVHFRGRSGIRAYDIANSLYQGWELSSILASSDAKHVLVRLGTNDLNNANPFTPDQIIETLAQIVSAITATGRIVHIATIEPRDLIGGYVASDTIRGVALNQLIMYRFASGINTYCVDVTKQCVDYSQTTKYTPIIAASTSVVHDGLHQSIRGAYVIGLALKSHFAQFRRDSFRHGAIHFLSTKANSSTKRKQLIAGPLMNTGVNQFAKTGLTLSAVMAPNGVGSALRVDSDASSVDSMPNSLAYQDISINSGDIIAGATIYGYAHVRISGPGGTGTPSGLKGFSLVCQLDRNGSTGFVQGARCNFSDSDLSGGYAANSTCEFTGDLLLVTPRYTFVGGDAISQPYLWFYTKALAGAQYRLEVYDAGVILENPGNLDKYPQFWSDANPPVAIY